MSRVHIHVWPQRVGPSSPSRVFAEWVGDVDWPGAPRRNDTWFHCGDWGGESFDRVSFNAPVGPDGIGMDIEVQTTADVIQHLIEDHGFTGITPQ